MFMITGGTGLLGIVIARKLAEMGEEIILFDAAPNTGQLHRLGNYSKNVHVKRGDILQMPDLLQVLKGKSVCSIIHTAGLLTPGVIERPYAGVQINFTGTLNVLEAARLAEVPNIVFCSSATVYDYSIKSIKPITEEHPVNPKSIYAVTKLASELLGENYKKLYGVGFSSFRFSQLYGPGFSQSGSASLWMDPLMRKIASGSKAIVIRPSRQVSEYIYIEDAANALVTAALRPKLEHSIFNISEGRLRNFSEIIEILSDTFGVDINVQEPENQEPYDERSQPYDLSRLQRELDFSVSYPMETAFPHYMESLIAQGIMA